MCPTKGGDSTARIGEAELSPEETRTRAATEATARRSGVAAALRRRWVAWARSVARDQEGGRGQTAPPQHAFSNTTAPEEGCAPAHQQANTPATREEWELVSPARLKRLPLSPGRGTRARQKCGRCRQKHLVFGRFAEAGMCQSCWDKDRAAAAKSKEAAKAAIGRFARTCQDAHKTAHGGRGGKQAGGRGGRGGRQLRQRPRSAELVA